MAVFDAMTVYFDNLLRAWKTRRNSLPKFSFNPTIDPRLYMGNPDREGYVFWRPLKKAVPHDLSLLENELNLKLHPSIQEYFNSYWFCSLGGKYNGTSLQLTPVLPAKELDQFLMEVSGYKRAHLGALDYTPIGVGSFQLLVISNVDGTVSLEDFESHSFKPLAPSLEELIHHLIV